MEIRTELKYGKESEPWKPNRLTAILQILLCPIALLVSLLIVALVVLYDIVTVGSSHISVRAVPKPVMMPNGEIYKRAPRD